MEQFFFLHNTCINRHFTCNLYIENILASTGVTVKFWKFRLKSLQNCFGGCSVLQLRSVLCDNLGHVFFELKINATKKRTFYMKLNVSAFSRHFFLFAYNTYNVQKLNIQNIVRSYLALPKFAHDTLHIWIPKDLELQVSYVKGYIPGILHIIYLVCVLLLFTNVPLET